MESEFASDVSTAGKIAAPLHREWRRSSSSSTVVAIGQSPGHRPARRRLKAHDSAIVLALLLGVCDEWCWSWWGVTSFRLTPSNRRVSGRELIVERKSADEIGTWPKPRG
jgi:hypothetical protein